MKYRRLSNEELESLEGAFTRFLAVNSVTADDWVKMKTDKSEQVEALIGTFSDMVIEKTLTDVKYLEKKLPKMLQMFHCGTEKIEMVGLQIEGTTDFDFTKNLSSEEMMRQVQASGAEVKLFKAEKKYSKDRLLELFDMMESGCLISKDEGLFLTLKGLA